MSSNIRPNVLIAIVAAAVIAMVGGTTLVDAGQAEYAAGIFGIVIAALAAVMKALTDPDMPMVPASVVMRMLDHEQKDDGVEIKTRFEVRPNAVICLIVIAILSGVGGYLTIANGAVELGYAIFALGIGASATTLADLVKPSDKDVPLPLAEKVAELIADSKSG